MRIFVSYAHNDSFYCRQIRNLLGAHDVWFDDFLRAGQEWEEIILAKLDWCDTLLYLLSPNSVRSEYCEKEILQAINNQKTIIPILIQKPAEIPEYLSHIQYIDFSNGYDQVSNVVNLLNALIEVERDLFRSSDANKRVSLTGKTSATRLPFNYISKLDQQKASANTKEKYSKDICNYLEIVAGIGPIPKEERTRFLSSLPVGLLVENLSVRHVRGWLEMLVAEGVSKLSPAKSAILSLVNFMAEDGLIDEILVHKMREIDVVSLETTKRPRRILDLQTVDKLINPVENPIPIIDIRNRTILSLLLVLRVREVTTLKWEHVRVAGNKVTLRSPVTGNPVSIPLATQKNLVLWRQSLNDHLPNGLIDDSPVTRRAHSRNGKLTENPLSAQGIRDILDSVTIEMGMDKVSPDDLRISMRQLLKQNPHDVL